MVLTGFPAYKGNCEASVRLEAAGSKAGHCTFKSPICLSVCIPREG